MARTRQRNSNIELLRIIAMLLIVMHHYSYHGLGLDLAYSMNRYVAGVAELGGRFGVVVFIMISGYYMCESKITGRKIALLWGEIFFYATSIVALVSLLKCGGYADALENIEIAFNIDMLRQILFPIGTGVNGFATDFIVLMALSPLLNLILHAITRQQLLTCLVIATTAWSIMPVLFAVQYDYGYVLWYAVLYLYAGYIRRYVDLDGNWRRNLVIGILAYAIVAVMTMIAIYVGHISGDMFYQEFTRRFMKANSPFMLLSGAELLLGFVKMSPFTNRTINAIGSATFGVYLIHDNDYVRPILWKMILRLPDTIYGTRYLIPHMIVSVIVIFTVCAVIDLIRQNTIERLYIHIIHKAQPVASALCSRYIDIVSRMIDGLFR